MFNLINSKVMNKIISQYNRQSFLSIICASLLLLVSISAGASSAKDMWKSAQESYTQGRFEDALKTYNEIEKSGYVSWQLFYNLGNTYFKLKDNARAILYYERALKLNPAGEDIKSNLELVREFSIDKIDAVPEFIIYTWIKSLNYSFSSDTWSMMSIIFLLFIVLLILYYRYGHRRGFRKLAFLSSIFFALLLLFAISFAWSQKHSFNQRDAAIVINPVVSVKSTPDMSGKDLFILHEGAKVLIKEEVGQWRRIEIADGRQGWLSSLDAEII